MPRNQRHRLPVLVLRGCPRCGGDLARNDIWDWDYTCIQCGAETDYNRLKAA